MKNRSSSKGFTLVELIVVIVILTGLAVYGMDGFAGIIAFKSRTDTENKLKAWKTASENVYQKYSSSIDNTTGQVLDLGGGSTVPQAAPNATTKRCTMDPTKLTEFARFAGFSSGDLVFDGHHSSFCMLITNRLSDVVAGTTLYYHSIAIVSPGGNGVIETDTSLDALGNLVINPAKDDVGILFDGRKFAIDRYNLTLERLMRAADAYTAYYASRYQSDSSRSLAVDYFSCGSSDCAAAVARWDAVGQMPATCTAPINMVMTTGISPHSVLGLSQPDVTDGWGNLFTIDNCTNTVRSPANSATSKQTPPYTAVISATLPGGAVLSVTSVGQI